MATITHTRASVDVAVACRGGRSVIGRLAGSDHLRPRPLPGAGDLARIALVQSAASLLTADHLSISVAVGAGARLELVEVAAMIAHDVRGGTPARIDVDVSLGAGACLIWPAQPLVLAAGSVVQRMVTLRLARGAQALLRDTIVLGRHGEVTGALRTRTTVTHEGVPLHVEELDTGDPEVLRSPAVLGGAAVLDAVARYGARGEADGALQLHGPGTLLVQTADETAATAARAAEALARWRAELLGLR